MRLSSRHQFSQNHILLSGFQFWKSKSCVFLGSVQIFHLVKVWERKEREMKWDCGLWPRPVQGTVTGSKLRSETLLSWRTVSLLAPGPWLHHGQGHQVWIDTVHTGLKRPSRQKSVVCVSIMSMDTVLIIVTQLYNQLDLQLIGSSPDLQRWLIRARQGITISLSLKGFSIWMRIDWVMSV